MKHGAVVAGFPVVDGSRLGHSRDLAKLSNPAFGRLPESVVMATAARHQHVAWQQHQAALLQQQLRKPQPLYPGNIPPGAPRMEPRGGLGYLLNPPHGKKLFRCPQCRYMTDRKNNLKRHIGTMHQECGKLLECCEVLFPSKAALRDHVMLFHRAGYKCRFCARNFCRKALLKRHLLVHGEQRDYVCTICEYGTSNKEDMDRHKALHQVRLQAQWRLYWNMGPGVDVDGNSWLKSYPVTAGRTPMLARRLQETHSSRQDPDDSHMLYDQNGNQKKNIEADKCCDIVNEISSVPENESNESNGHWKTDKNRLCASPYKCSECSRTFPKQAELIAHAQSCRKSVPESALPLKLLLPHGMRVLALGTHAQTNYGDFIDTLKLLKAIGMEEEMSECETIDSSDSHPSHHLEPERGS